MAQHNMHQTPAKRRIKLRSDPLRLSACSRKRILDQEFLRWIRSSPSLLVKRLFMRQSNRGHHDTKLQLLLDVHATLQRQSMPAMALPVESEVSTELEDLPTRVRILHMSDTHNQHRTIDIGSLPRADLLIHTGDFTFAEKEDEQWEDFDLWLGEVKKSQPGIQIVVIAGNHDWRRRSLAQEFGMDLSVLFKDSICQRLSNAIVLDHTWREVCGLKIFGMSWLPWQCSNPNRGEFFEVWFAWQEGLSEDDRGKIHRFDEIPEGVDILLTHCPAKGILDWSEGNKSGGSSKALRAAIRRSKPRAHLFGHIHESRGVWCKQRDGSFEGGVEYEASGEDSYARSFDAARSGKPPVDYPCQLISNNGMFWHRRLDKGIPRLVGETRLIVAEREPDGWCFSVGRS